MEEFLRSVYDVPPEEDVLNGALQVFSKVKWTRREQLVGAMDADIDGICDQDIPIPVKVFMRAATRTANAAANALRTVSPASASAGPDSQPLQTSVSQAHVQDVVGADLSAATVAKLLAAGNDEVDVAKQLKDMNMAKLPYHMQCDRLVWKVLEAESKAANTAKRIAYAYVDITAKEVLPLWLPQDAIGGKSIFGSEWGQSDGSASTLAELGRALQAATTQHKVFRSYPQWMGAFLKYAAAAMGMKQLTISQVLSYLNVIAKIYEEEKNSNGCCLVAILYGDVFRKTVSRRAEAKDPELDMDDAFAKTDISILEACKARVESVARATPGASRAAGQREDQSSGHHVSAESHLAKQTAAAEAAAKKVETATRALDAAQKRIEESEGSSGSRKDAKRGLWIANQMAQGARQKFHRYDGRKGGKGFSKGGKGGKW